MLDLRLFLTLVINWYNIALKIMLGLHLCLVLHQLYRVYNYLDYQYQNLPFLVLYQNQKKKIEDLVKNISQEKKTSVFFVSGHKLIVFLEYLERIVPDRSISVCKELTKINEFVFRGISRKVKNNILKDRENIKGEFVVVIDGKTIKKQDFDEIDLYKDEIKKMTKKFSLTDIVEIVHKFTKINKNKIYKWLLKLKK